MKARQFILLAMLMTGAFISSCGNSGTDASDIKAADSPSIDSTLPAHNVDPSTAFPQPPVSGTQEDSSGLKDTLKKKGDTSIRK